MRDRYEAAQILADTAKRYSERQATRRDVEAAFTAWVIAVNADLRGRRLGDPRTDQPKPIN